MLVIEILKLIPKMLIEFKQCMPLTIYLDMHSQLENVKPEPESGLCQRRLFSVVPILVLSSSALPRLVPPFLAHGNHLPLDSRTLPFSTSGQTSPRGGGGPKNTFSRKSDPTRPPPTLRNKKAEKVGQKQI